MGQKYWKISSWAMPQTPPPHFTSPGVRSKMLRSANRVIYVFSGAFAELKKCLFASSYLSLHVYGEFFENLSRKLRFY